MDPAHRAAWSPSKMALRLAPGESFGPDVLTESSQRRAVLRPPELADPCSTPRICPRGANPANNRQGSARLTASAHAA